MNTDPVFEEEQAHLTATFEKLAAIEQEALASLEGIRAEAAQDNDDMRDEFFLNQDADIQVEQLVEYESLNRIIEGYNLAHEINADRLSRARLLMRQPYFAKVSLRFKPGEEPRDIYLGAAGMTDETCRHFIVDWRSPVAETYYNQDNGRTFYRANGRTIEAELTLRRQFSITGPVLHGYFDTTVAIEDPLLLAAVSRGHSEKLRAITATIQREQNLVVRHDDTPVLLVGGIAGSGKTSVLLQRIAYLFYRQRDSLRPDQVYLFTPNPVFQRYIDNVLPEMGERNPQVFTWKAFLRSMGLDQRGWGLDTPASALREIDEKTAGMALEPDDFCDVRLGDEKVLGAGVVRQVANKHRRIPVGPRLAGLVSEDLHDRLESRLKQLAKSDDVLDTLEDLPVEEQVRIFGAPYNPQNEAEATHLAQLYVADRYSRLHDDIDNACWLRFDRIGMRLLGKESLNGLEWLYLNMAITGTCRLEARYVMVDEVQDYTQAQLMVLARYFRRSHFLLLGDPNQAIAQGTASFEDIRGVFRQSHGQVDECQLLTSYRSSPEITALFTGLMEADERVKTSSVQRAGVAPDLRGCLGDAYEETLRGLCAEAAAGEGLTAFVTPDRRSAKRLAKELSCVGAVGLHENAVLPARGVVVLDLALAKGLEFDHVIVTDADDRCYPAGELSRRRLYTAISRATHRVSVVARDQLTSMLA